MNVKEFKEIIKNIPEDVEVTFRKVGDIGNITGVYNVELTTYGFFGGDIACIILDSYGEYGKGRNKEKLIYGDALDEE